MNRPAFMEEPEWFREIAQQEYDWQAQAWEDEETRLRNGDVYDDSLGGPL